MTDAELDHAKHDSALLRSIVSQRVELKRDGNGRWKGRCPFHNVNDHRRGTPIFIE
jgi:hypothetical protein